MNKTESALLVAHLSLKETRNIIDNDVWERLGFGRLITLFRSERCSKDCVVFVLKTSQHLVNFDPHRNKLLFSNKWFYIYICQLDVQSGDNKDVMSSKLIKIITFHIMIYRHVFITK